MMLTGRHFPGNTIVPTKALIATILLCSVASFVLGFFFYRSGVDLSRFVPETRLADYKQLSPIYIPFYVSSVITAVAGSVCMILLFLRAMIKRQDPVPIALGSNDILQSFIAVIVGIGGAYVTFFSGLIGASGHPLRVSGLFLFPFSPVFSSMVPFAIVVAFSQIWAALICQFRPAA